MHCTSAPPIRTTRRHWWRPSPPRRQRSADTPGGSSISLCRPSPPHPSSSCSATRSWRRSGPDGGRVIAEKPFGTDLASAQALNATFHAVFDESQIFRIDHFLGKESVDNLLALRFADRAGSVAVIVGDAARQDDVRDALAEAAEALVTGPGADAGTDVCPLIAPEARERIAEAIDRATREGATLVLDGRDAEGPSGSWLAPCILEVADREAEPAREELFGPLLTLVRAADLDDALEFVNGSRYGNAGSIFTESGGAARAYRAGVETGMIGVNVGVAAPVAWFPFSGWKDSIDGDLHANGRDAVSFYTRRKVVTSRWN